MSAASASLVGSGGAFNSGRPAGRCGTKEASQHQGEFYVAREGSFIQRKTNRGCCVFKNKCLIDKNNT